MFSHGTILTWVTLAELVCVAGVIASNSVSSRTRRLAPPKNTTAPEYVIDFGKPISQTVLEATDYACGKRHLCDKSNSFFHYPSNCFGCETDGCKCDDLCHQYGDCCNDKATRKPQRTPFSRLVSCETKLEERHDDRGSGIGYLAVTKCPDRSPSDASFLSLVKKCDTPNFRDIRQATPVWAAKTNLTYRNEFCAACHSIHTYERWMLSAKCNSSQDFSNVGSVENIWPKVVDLKCPIFTEKPAGNYLRKCRHDVVDTCDETIGPHNGTLKYLCDSLTSVVKFNGTWYKNVFCGVCNGVVLDRTKHCDSEVRVHRGGRTIPPLSVLLKFYPTETAHQDTPNHTGPCPPKSVYNPVLGRCSQLTCARRRALMGNHCQPIFQSCAGLGYSLSATRYATAPVRLNSTGYLRRRFERQLTETLAHYKPYFRSKLSLTIVGERILGPERYVIVHSLSFSVRVVSSSNRSMVDLESDLLRMIQRPLTFRRNGEQLQFSSKSELPQNSPVGKSNKTDRGVLYSSKNKADSPGVFGLRCKKGECLTSVKYLQVSNLINCSCVEFEISDIKGNISFHGSTITVDSRRFMLRKDYFRTFGARIKMCLSEVWRFSDFLNGTEDTANQDTESQDATWKSVLSTICLALSTIFLLLTFGVYCAAIKLRTLAGKNTMALVFHLFFAQLTYLSGVNAVDNVHICRGIGIVIHFLWLASFFWMFICAYHTFTTFSNMYTNNTQFARQRAENRHFRHYMLFAEISPAVLVLGSICYSLARTDGTEVGYGGDLCFLNSKETLGIFFASPLILVLIFNVFFFVRAVISIPRTPDILKGNHQCNRNYLGIYFRLSILLGFGWIFGFLADINVILFCLFIIFTGGQGIFIFFSFCCNIRALTLVSETVPCLRCLLPKDKKANHSHASETLSTE